MEMRESTDVLFKVLITYAIIAETLQCGITTHIEIAHRAYEFYDGRRVMQAQVGEKTVDFQKLIVEHQDAFQAGNPYPDAYYNPICQYGVYHDISEDTHWTPFMNATINYIRNHYPPPWNKATEKLIVFLLGLISHQVADVSWHSLGINHGFLSVMGDVNYHGSFDNAHSDGDPGGDVLNQYELNTNYIHELSDWYVPVDDLVNIYRELYGADRMPESVIEECTMFLFLGRLGEQLAIAKLLPKYASKSPFLVDKLNDFFLGGVFDMSVWTTNIWDKALFMLDKGTSACDLPHNPLYISCNMTNLEAPPRKQQGSRNAEKNGFFVASRFPGLSRGDVLIRRTKRGVYLSASKRVKHLFKKQAELSEYHQNKTLDQYSRLNDAKVKTAISSYTLSRPYARVGGFKDRIT
ncbi:unnamed protein product [Owenia fusiformis]|uniref:Phospholipase C/D domain-containing protein n=1 Tax=Owenia fusiformis TaxID=6347 RepID=A0A8J1U9Y8_OWEFU|nr:unnamed protein product [Owenia fusiformis]